MYVGVGYIARVVAYLPSDSSPTFQMIAGFYNGVLGGSIPPITAPCASGNCTWLLTPSLAVCGSCQVNITLPPPRCYTTCPPSQNCSSLGAALFAFCDYTLPSGAVATIWNFGNKTATNLFSTWGQTGFQSISSKGAYYNSSKEDRMYIANFDLFGVPFNSYQPTYRSAAVNFTHHECALWFCVETYNDSVVDNKYIHNVVSTINEANMSSRSFTLVGSAADPKNATTYSTAGSVAVDVIQMWMSKELNGSIGLLETAQNFSSDVMGGVWNGTRNPQAWIQDIATSLTNVVRVYNQTNRDEYNGTAYQLGVNVRWTWISLPTTLVVLSIVFLLTVMVRTALSPVAPWKGSPLTLLLFDIDHAAKEASYGQVYKYKGIQRAVGGMTVRMKEQPGRAWTFKAT
ncbi:hypothetical protein BAUCODRAFT_551020 [Baudoinia panamericana UAMH 10762]|uniref:Uncharacterized protein n=1 Tax=Baudoinia panamericana (strain UAMH 10762) TaxID=717646 RepID=M2MDD8_BAUPA|nr:uncharacterized protein BAUCODRAFT_551020 [Baudoinia panamericana UAMH 10762]EMC94526.1 hypothetical protein BAUCODRAFT_551020 [Baudoinia panamericana UAMH 10762]